MKNFDNFGFDGKNLNDSDFNDFYEEFVSSKPTGTFTPPTTSGGTQYSSPIGTLVPKGESSPAVDPAQKDAKSGFWKGVGNFLQSDTGRAVLTGVSKGIENQGLGGGGYGGATPPPPPPPNGLSTGAIIGISVGVLALIGLGVYFVTKK